jgi:hypothetical protein
LKGGDAGVPAARSRRQCRRRNEQRKAGLEKRHSKPRYKRSNQAAVFRIAFFANLPEQATVVNLS